jgi:Cys-rich four helix bundle protein (predicted Tat secretion target)
MKGNSPMNENLSRRDVVKCAIAATTALASGAVLGAEDAANHSHHADNPTLEVVDAAMNCVKKSQACIEHCMQLFQSGDTTLAKCADLVQETIAMCDALAQMASYHSKHLSAVAKVCISVSQDCEDECRKYAEKHVECKECADSCAVCIKACEKVTV